MKWVNSDPGQEKNESSRSWEIWERLRERERDRNRNREREREKRWERGKDEESICKRAKQNVFKLVQKGTEGRIDISGITGKNNWHGQIYLVVHRRVWNAVLIPRL